MSLANSCHRCAQPYDDCKCDRFKQEKKMNDETLLSREEDAKKGQKFDGNKPMMQLLPLGALQDIAKVLTFGAQKYTANGWKDVPDAENRYLGALLRHLTAIQEGEEYDPESGLKHIEHVGCNALFLVWFANHKL